jgi:aspartate kinase
MDRPISQRIEAAIIRDIRVSEDDLRVSLRGLSNVPGTAAKIFTALASENVNVNLIVQNMTIKGEDWADISFTVNPSEIEKVRRVLNKAREQKLIDGYESHEEEKILVVEGDGMQTHTDIAARIFKRLGEAGINIEMICTSELEISCAVSQTTSDASLQMLREEFKEEISSA